MIQICLNLFIWFQTFLRIALLSLQASGRSTVLSFTYLRIPRLRFIVIVSLLGKSSLDWERTHHWFPSIRNLLSYHFLCDSLGRHIFRRCVSWCYLAVFGWGEFGWMSSWILEILQTCCCCWTRLLLLRNLLLLYSPWIILRTLLSIFGGLTYFCSLVLCRSLRCVYLYWGPNATQLQVWCVFILLSCLRLLLCLLSLLWNTRCTGFILFVISHQELIELIFEQIGR